MPSQETYQSEQQLVATFDLIDDGFFIMDRDFVVIYANKAFEQHAGRKRKEVLGKTIWQGFPHIAYPTSPYRINYAKVLKDKKPITFTNLNTHQSWVQIKAFPTQEGGIAVFVSDITEGVNAQKALEESEQRFRMLTSMTSDIIFRSTPDWSKMIRLDNRKFRNNSSVARRDWFETLVPKEKVVILRAQLRVAIKEKKALNLELPIMRPGDDFESWMIIRAVPILNDKGKIIEWFGTITDITERHKQDEVRERMNLVTEQRNALIKLNKAKDEFVAIASHQLRTPATAVKQYTGMLLGGFAGDLEPQHQALLQSAYDANERELELINDLLKTAQIDGTSHNFKTEPHNIIDILRRIVTEHASLVEQRDQRIRLTYTRNNVTIPVDAIEIKLALANLIENASKYSYDGAVIDIHLHLEKTFVEITIKDKGVGIDEDDSQRIFDKFTRIRNELTDVVHGTGLGLYWVKKIVEMHSGSVMVTSALGEGSTFTIRLPRSTATN